MADNYMAMHRAVFIELAALHKLPAVYPFRIGPADGGLLSYGPNFSELFDPVGPYVNRILKGAKVNELPVQVPTRRAGSVCLNRNPGLISGASAGFRLPRSAAAS
jgi:putative ABC transport system substrate-binding protein